MTPFRSLWTMLVTFLGLFLTIPLVLLGLPFLVIASLTRIIARFIEPEFVPWQDLIEFDPIVGWKPKPNLDAYYLTNTKDDIFHVITDAQGWLGKANLADSEVVVFGDSFAFGYGVDAAASFAQINPDLRIKAIGSPGYNMVQELLWMQQLSSELKGKLIIWFICLENDLIDNLSPELLSHRNPFIRRQHGRGDWEIVSTHLNPTKWNYSPKWRPYLDILAKLCVPGDLSERVYSACEFLVKQGSEICKHGGGQLVVFTIPNAHQLSPVGLNVLAAKSGDTGTFDPDYPDRQIATVCARLAIPFVAAKMHLGISDYKSSDPHWSEAGHLRVANLLVQLHQAFVSSKRTGLSNKACEGMRSSQLRSCNQSDLLVGLGRSFR